VIKYISGFADILFAEIVNQIRLVLINIQLQEFIV